MNPSITDNAAQSLLNHQSDKIAELQSKNASLEKRVRRYAAVLYGHEKLKHVVEKKDRPTAAH